MGSLYIRRRIRATTGVLREQLQFFTDPLYAKADGFGFRPPQTARGRVDLLRHLDESLKLGEAIGFCRTRIFGIQQASCHAQSVHLSANPQQFLLLCP